MNISVKKLAFAAVIAAVYAGLTMMLAPISYGALQFRISEVLCILPFFFPASAWGLFIGCIIANLLSAFGLADIVFGSMATLLAGLCTMYLGRLSREKLINKVLACLPPVVFNGVIVGAVIAASAAGNMTAFWPLFALNGIQVAVGELAVLYIIGLPLMIWLPGKAFFQKLLRDYE